MTVPCVVSRVACAPHWSVVNDHIHHHWPGQSGSLNANCGCWWCEWRRPIRNDNHNPLRNAKRVRGIRLLTSPSQTKTSPLQIGLDKPGQVWRIFACMFTQPSLLTAPHVHNEKHLKFENTLPVIDADLRAGAWTKVVWDLENWMQWKLEKKLQLFFWDLSFRSVELKDALKTLKTEKKNKIRTKIIPVCSGDCTDSEYHCFVNSRFS